jgi:hypothetical protein
VHLLKPHDVIDESSGTTAWELMQQPCRTKEELRNWLKVFLNLDPPDTVIDPESNCTPLDMAWKVYSNCVWYEFLPDEERETKMIFYATRMGFKTLMAAAVEFMISIHDQRGIVHTAATTSQARKAFNDYFKLFLSKPIFRPFVDGDTELNVARALKNTADQFVFGNRVNIKIIPTTKQAAQSQHEALLCRDEIDVVEDKQAYKDLDGIPIDMPDKRPPIDFGISVRKTAFGLVQKQIEEAQKTGIGVYHWNIMDITERCPDEKSGTAPVKLYVLNDTMHYISEEEYTSLELNEKRKYTEMDGLEGCYNNCTLFAACQTNLKKQNSRCKWLKAIDFVEERLQKVPEDVFIAQMLSRKPPTEGLVYSRFDKKNIKSYREMYEIFAGEPWKNPTMSLGEFIGVMKKHNIPAYAGVDWGYTAPCVCTVAYIDRNENVFVVYTLSRLSVDNADFIELMSDEIQSRFDIQMYFPDSENPSGISMMAKANLPCSRKVEKKKGSVYDGVQIIKSFITVPGTNKPKMFVAEKNNDLLIYEFGKYHHETDASGTINDLKFAKEDDHSMDALRYVMYTLFGKNPARLTVVSSKEGRSQERNKAKDKHGKFYKAPTAQELAQHLGQGKFRDNRDDYDTDGEKKDKEEDKTGGSAGGFSWSF